MKKIITVVQFLLFCVIIICIGVLIFYFYQSHASKAEIISMKKSIVEEVDYTKRQNGVAEAYYNLYMQNNDFAGWLTIEGTSIDYPVMQTDNNDFYIHRNFSGKYQYGGLPFVDYQCSLQPQSTNIIIYAHNMKDGSMFAPLLKYSDKEFYQNHREIIFNTIYNSGKYEILSVFYAKPQRFGYHEFIDTENSNEFDGFIQNIKEISLYDTGVNATYGDNLLTLSTCAYNSDDERLVVVAKKTC